jgi:hypothetical protein
MAHERDGPWLLARLAHGHAPYVGRTAPEQEQKVVTHLSLLDPGEGHR